jgi:cytidylate kinase
MNASSDNGRSYTAVTLSRQLGSGGDHVGYLVSRELGFRYVDREVVSRAAKTLETTEAWIEEIEERSSGVVERILGAFTLGTPESVSLPLLKPPVYERDVFDLECGIIRAIADRCNTVIVGRGGFYALRNRPGVIRIFIHAPREFRVRRIMEVQNISSIDEAREIVDESDRNRARFIRDMTGFLWSDARNFHLAIDTGTIDFETAAGMIANVVRKCR